jgi:hypothetical protein
MAIQILKTNLILALLIFNIAFWLYITIKRKADPVMPLKTIGSRLTQRFFYWRIFAKSLPEKYDFNL